MSRTVLKRERPTSPAWLIYYILTIDDNRRFSFASRHRTLRAAADYRAMSTLSTVDAAPLVRSLRMAVLTLGAAIQAAVCFGQFDPQTAPRPAGRTTSAAAPLPAGPEPSPSATTSPAPTQPVPGVRNVILMVGDGMGPQQVGLLQLYARYAKRSTVPDRTAAIERIYNEGVLGVMRTECHGAMVVDSAASATQLSTGKLAGSEMIGLDYRGDRAEHILEVAHRLGKSAGLVTETRITHATPAGFAAHQQSRNMENEIAVDLLDNHPEVLLGGGLRHFVPEAINNRDSAAYDALMQTTGATYPASSKRLDNRNLLLEARDRYKLVFDRAALAKADRGPLLGLFADSEMLDALREEAVASDPKRTQPTLVEMTEKALEILDQNPKGFFLMIEGGQIDWAGHNNDAGLLLHELLQFDAAVRVVYEWVRQRDDTLLVVTADHETGSFGFSYAGRPLPKPVKLPGAAFRDSEFAPNFNYAPPELLDQIYDQRKSYFSMISEFEALPLEQQKPETLVDIVNAASAFHIDIDDATTVLTRARNRSYVPGHPYMNTPTVPKIDDFEPFFVYGEFLKCNLLGRALAGKQHTVWGSGTHTSTPVLLGAFGPPEATQRFVGMLHSTDVGQRMIELLSAGQSRTGAASAAAPQAPPAR